MEKKRIINLNLKLKNNKCIKKEEMNTNLKFINNNIRRISLTSHII